jgi:glucosamine 6-phosphate synthetase-like amidotransferase/phosphosugar isomerase protein
MRISRQPSPVRSAINTKKLQNVEYCNCLGSMITNDARCTHEIKSGIEKEKSAFN